MRGRPWVVVALLAVTQAHAVPATAAEPRHYCLQIQEALTEQSATTCSYHADAPRPVARIRQTLTDARPRNAAVVRLCAYGAPRVGRFRLTGVPGSTDVRVRYTRSDGVDITAAVLDGSYRTRFMAPDDCFRYRISVAMTASARSGDLRTFSLTADPEGPGWATTKAATHVTVG